ncbi:MAG TPA: hypothetical protein VG457_01780, partial [Planctomycetota bacterium]|nr:hypothetical protein [Planctomycetota bacterium]
PPPPPPPPATEIVITEDDEVHYVVYREYFGCSETEIYAYPHYRRYYAVSDDDLYFITFVARRRGIAFDVCFRSYYYDCGRNYDRLVVTYNVPRSSFFCSVNVGVNAYPPVYQRTYVAYQQNNVTNITIQNNEYVALVHMKVGVEYQGHPPATFFAQVNANGGNTGKVIVANRESCGKGGVSATGAKVTVTAQHPWTMPPEKKEAWHEEHKAQVVKHEDTFKQVHQDQVKRVQTQPAQKTAAGQSKEPKSKEEAGGPKNPSPNAQGTPGSAPGEKRPAGEVDPKGPKQPQGAAQGEKHAPGEVDPKGPKQPQGAQGQGQKDPQNAQGQQPKKDEPHKQVEGAKQPPPKEKKKGEKDEEEKKGGK